MIDRGKLDEIILKNETNDWWRPEQFVKNTKYLLPKELEILADPPAETANYNCFIYALGLHDDQSLITETGGFIYDTLIKQLIKEWALEKTTHPEAGDLVVYQDKANYPEHLTHIGVLQSDGSVISKWAWGPLIKHALFDVPASYGNDVFYLEGISRAYAHELYEKYKKFNLKPSA